MTSPAETTTPERPIHGMSERDAEVLITLGRVTFAELGIKERNSRRRKVAMLTWALDVAAFWPTAIDVKLGAKATPRAHRDALSAAQAVYESGMMARLDLGPKLANDPGLESVLRGQARPAVNKDPLFGMRTRERRAANTVHNSIREQHALLARVAVFLADHTQPVQ